MHDNLTSPPFTLMYHSVADASADPYRITVSPGRFAAHMRLLHRAGLRGVSMGELLGAARQGAATGRMVGLTFDDGYADFTTEVLPILARYRFTATLFVVAGKLGGHNDWDGDGPVKPLMTADQVRQAAGRGIEIGSHGMNHRALAAADPELLKLELQSSRDALTALLDTPIDGFAYHYGDLSDSALLAARAAGYDYAAATWHLARNDPHALPRTYVGEKDGAARLLAKRVRHRLTWERRNRR
jgi:peptidoglycan/xylan/chitin deacetylase (PgdA/CDA1 family)